MFFVVVVSLRSVESNIVNLDGSRFLVIAVE